MNITKLDEFNLLGLKDIKESEFEIDIRIFRWQAFGKPELLWIYKDKDKWISKLYLYYPEYEESKTILPDSSYQEELRVVRLDSLEEKTLLPKEKIQEIWERLTDFGIYSFPTYQALQEKYNTNLYLTNDGIVYDFYLKYKNRFRYYNYLNPSIISKVKPQIKELKRFNKMIAFLEKSFGINLNKFDYSRLKKNK